MKDIVVIYHAECPDGVGGAFAAYKKFGASADYVGGYRTKPLPTGLAGKEVYLIDFSYSKDIMLPLEKEAKRLVVLDHHAGVQKDIEAVREHVFDNNRSGAGIAWEYFHPGTPLPKLLAYIQDCDLWRFALPDSKAVAAYLGTVDLTFDSFEQLLPQLEDATKLQQIIERGKAYADYAEFLCTQTMQAAEEVEFEGYKILAINGGRSLHSLLGNMMAKKHPPFSIVWYRHHGVWHFSLRGDGTVNLAELAQRHSGNGHHNAAGFTLPFGSPMPFTFLA